MPQRVVDRLEAIQIKIADCHYFIFALSLKDGLFYPVSKQHPIGYAGKRIIMGNMP